MSDDAGTNRSISDLADDAPQPSLNPNAVEAEEPPIPFRDLAPAIEFCCWVVVALAPFLRWVNGAAVTDDQFVIQVALVTLAFSGGVGLRLYQWLGKNRDSVQSRNE
jgi:hypothetical protein